MVDCTLDQVWRQYELDNRKNLTVDEVAQATGLHRDTIANLRNRKTHRYDRHVIAKIAEFFKAEEGKPVPFLVVRYSGKSA